MASKASLGFGIVALIIPIVWFLAVWFMVDHFGYSGPGYAYQYILVFTIIMSSLAITFGIVRIISGKKKGESPYLAIVGLVLGSIAIVVYFLAMWVVLHPVSYTQLF
ncbi:MAG: hypothetical protein ACFE8V_12795 [Promethearchaeota archaeon]